MIADNAVVTPAKGSRWEDFVDVYLAPVDLFVRRADETWLKPFLLLCAVGIVLYYAFLPLNAAMWEAAMIENAPDGADLDRMRQGAALMKYLGGIFVPFGYAFMIAVTAVGLKLVSSLLEPAADWRQSFLISTFAYFVMIPQQILGGLLVFMKTRSGELHMRDASFGVLRFIEKPDQIVRALLGRLDIFPIWTAILCSVGLAVVVRMPRNKAILTAAITWALVALPGLVSALLTSRK